MKPGEDHSSGCLFAEINGCLVLGVDTARGITCSRATDWGQVAAFCKYAFPLDRWTRIAVTYDLSALRVYVDGQCGDAVPCTGFRASNVTAIGCNPFGARSAFFEGCLDDISLTARAFSDEEIARDAMQ